MNEIQLSFSFDRTLAKKYIYETEAFEPVGIGDYFVQIHSVTISPLSISVDLECTPVEGSYQSEKEFIAHGADILPWISFADEDGMMIEYTNLDWIAGWEMNMLGDGSMNYRLRQVLPGLKERPFYIVLLDDFAKVYDIMGVSAAVSLPDVVLIPIQYK